MGPGALIVNGREVESKALVGVFRPYQPAAVYLFGSYARGADRPSSDIDLAILFGDGRSLHHDEWLAAVEALRNLVGAEVDLVVLDEARPHVRAEILATGQVLYETSPAERAVREERVLGEYGDAQALVAGLVRDIEDCLTRLERFVPVGDAPAQLHPDAHALTHHYLWRACQGLLDLARLVARHTAMAHAGTEAARLTYWQAFRLLGREGVLTPPLVRQGQALVDLRNKLVHEYLLVKPDAVEATLGRQVPAMKELLESLAATPRIPPSAS